MPGIKGYDHDGGIQPYEHRPNEKSRAKVVGFRCAGYNQEEVAEFMDISVETLVKYYPIEVKTARENKLRRVSNVAYKLALKGDRKMIELVLRTQGRWFNAKAPEDVEKDKKESSLIEKLMDKL